MAADFNSCQYLSRKCGPLEYTVHGRKTTLKFRHVYVNISDYLKDQSLCCDIS